MSSNINFIHIINNRLKFNNAISSNFSKHLTEIFFLQIFRKMMTIQKSMLAANLGIKNLDWILKIVWRH